MLWILRQMQSKLFSLPRVEDCSSMFRLEKLLLLFWAEVGGGNCTPLYFEGFAASSTEPNISPKSIWKISLNSSSENTWGWWRWAEPSWGMINGALLAGIFVPDCSLTVSFEICLSLVEVFFSTDIKFSTPSVESLVSCFIFFAAFSDLFLSFFPFFILNQNSLKLTEKLFWFRN